MHLQIQTQLSCINMKVLLIKLQHWMGREMRSKYQHLSIFYLHLKFINYTLKTVSTWSLQNYKTQLCRNSGNFLFACFISALIFLTNIWHLVFIFQHNYLYLYDICWLDEHHPLITQRKISRGIYQPKWVIHISSQWKQMTLTIIHQSLSALVKTTSLVVKFSPIFN